MANVKSASPSDLALYYHCRGIWDLLVLVLRHYEDTDDAYVAGNRVQIMAQVSGSVTKVWADNTDFVKQGDVLVTLDQTDAKQAFEKPKLRWPPACVRRTS